MLQRLRHAAEIDGHVSYGFGLVLVHVRALALLGLHGVEEQELMFPWTRPPW